MSRQPLRSNFLLMLVLAPMLTGCENAQKSDTSNPPITRDRVETTHFVVRPLTVEDAELDWKAVMASVELLREQFDGSWPQDNFSIEDNRADIQTHEAQHRSGEVFTYTIIRSDESEILGCIYIAADAASSKQTVLGWLRSDLTSNSLRLEIARCVDLWLKTHWQVSDTDRKDMIARWK